MVRFVDHENRRQSLLAAGDDVMRNLQQKFTLVLAGTGKPEIADDVLQELDRGETSVEDVGVCDILALLQRLQQAAEQKSFSGAHFSG